MSAAGVHRELGADHLRDGEQRDQRHADRAASRTGRAAGLRSGTAARTRAPAWTSLPLGHDQQDDEQDEERHAGRKPDQAVGPSDVLGRRARQHADDEAADVGERQAGERPDGGGAEGLDDQQREQQRLEAEGRGDEDAGDGGEARSR